MVVIVAVAVWIPDRRSVAVDCPAMVESHPPVADRFAVASGVVPGAESAAAQGADLMAVHSRSEAVGYPAVAESRFAPAEPAVGSPADLTQAGRSVGSPRAVADFPVAAE